MPSTHNEKSSSSLDHNEHSHYGSGKNQVGEPVIEPVNYGYNGVKAWFGSPYVLGASMLASMGGFSYGYGMSPPSTYPFMLQTDTCDLL